MHVKILNVACALLDKYDFQPNATVCISYDNSDHLFILACAVICVGGIVACSYSCDPYAELLSLARKVDASFLFCHRKNIAWAAQLERDLGRPVKGVIMERQLEQRPQHDHFEQLFWYDSLKSSARARVPVACVDLKKQVSVITMSSGTSGKPKAVAQTHWNALAELLAGNRSAGRGINFACSASLDYISGRLILFGALHSGYQTIILDGFEPRTFLQACERYRVHIIYIGAASFYNLITYPHIDEFDLSSVKCVFPMGAKIIYLKELRAFFERHPHIERVRQGYGASEISGGAMNSMTPEEFLSDCENCGPLMPGMRAKIVHPTSGRLLGPNEQGILHLRGETVFPGYYDRERARKRSKTIDKISNLPASDCDLESPFINDSEVFDADGFYITGDYAYFNDKEQLYFVGRQKEMMNCRGLKRVLPQELEALLDQHPAVFKVCVLGVQNEREPTLHCPRAFVVPQASCYTDAELPLSERLPTLNEELDRVIGDELLEHTGNAAHPLCRLAAEHRRRLAEDLMQFINERVGWEKQLTGGVVLLDDIPTSRATGKFNKNYLRALSPTEVELYGDRSGTSAIE